jgi:D-psicose/D-tagatose/L-ribulose 3-epimerase
MKFGIHYIYWRNDLKCKSYIPYIKRAKECGYDVLELGDYLFLSLTDKDIDELKAAASYYDVELALGIDPPYDRSLSSENESQRKAGISFYTDLLPKFRRLGLNGFGGNMLNAPFRAPYSEYHQMEWDNSVKSLKEICKKAAEYGLQVNCEIVNRYEGHIVNTAKGMFRLLEEVDEPNGKMTLDSFHVNVEENSFSQAIFDAGNRLGHFHLMENHRGLLGTGHMPIFEIRDALNEIHYEGVLTQECLVRAGDELGDCCRIWRDMTGWASEQELDDNARRSVEAMRFLFQPGQIDKYYIHH